MANVIGLFPDLLSKKMQDKQQYPPEIVEARNYLTTKDIETGVLNCLFVCLVCLFVCLFGLYLPVSQ